jgi:N-acetylmuramoyl-L-alanine amidase
MPSILIETGFITNKKEGDYLNSKKGQDQISKSIAQSILKYKSQLEFNIGEQIITDIPQQNTSLNQTVYKIQIAASSRKVKTTAKNFKGLTNITVQKNGGIFRYFYSQTNNFKKAQQLKKEAIDRGFTDAIIKRFDP